MICAFRSSRLGLVFGAFGLAYALFEIPMGLIGRPTGRTASAGADCAGMVRIYGTDRRGMECDIAGGNSVLVRGRPGWMFPEPDAHAERMAAGTRAGDSAGADVGMRAMGRRGNTAAYAPLH